MNSPTPLDLLTSWRWQPVAIIAVLAALAWYAYRIRGLGRSWPRRYVVAFGLGAALFIWASCGFLAVYAHALFWVWVTQQLMMLLVIPPVLMAGQPVELSRRDHGLLARIADGPLGRPLANPLISPALVPVVSALLVFGPVPGLAARSDAFGWPLSLLVVIIGAGIALPLVSAAVERSSVAVGLALLVGSFELILDAIPGIVLRLSTEVGTFFDHRPTYSWSSTALDDQRLAGSILWGVAELLDLPFLVIIFWRWIRADEREAADTDVMLDAERIARGDEEEGTDPPWWLTDSRLRDRFPHR